MTIDVQVNADTSPAIQALDRLGTKIEQIQGKFSDSFGKMNIAATALGASLLALGSSVAHFADEITDIAAANGIATAEVLAFQGALQASGGKADAAGMALQRLSQAVDDANGGNMKAVGSFAKLGVSMQDLGTLGQSEIRQKLLTALSEIPDAMQRNALATEFFGKALIGADLTKMIENERDAREEADKFAPALETAGNAFDNLLKIAKQIKLAFAEAFEPLFKLISNIKVDVDLLVVGFRAMGAALIVITAAGVLRGVLALKDAFILLNAVVSRNPLIALASAAAGIAAYVGLTKDAADATKDVTDANKDLGKETNKVSRDQTGYKDILEKQRTAISKSTIELMRGFRIAKDKYDVDLQGLGLTEDQKNAAAARAKIDQDADKAKADAQAAFDALDTVSQGKQRSFLKETIDNIDKKSSAEKAASDQRFANLAKERDLQLQLIAIANVNATGTKAIVDAQMKFSNSRIQGINEEIDAEKKLEAVGNLRADLLTRVGRLAGPERDNAIKAISDIVDNADNLKGSMDDVATTMKRAFGEAKLSDQAKAVLTGEPFQAFIDNGKTAADVAKQITAESRTFADGWAMAFKSYNRDATNAALQAQQLFSTVTRSIEDGLIGMAKGTKDSFKTMLVSIAEQIVRSNIKQLLSNVFTPEGSSSSIISTLLGGAKSLLGFANGGIIPTSGPVIVGERGPEILSGAQGRSVTPNNQLGGTVVYNINAVDARSFKQMVAADPSFIHAVASQGAKYIPSRR